MSLQSVQLFDAATAAAAADAADADDDDNLPSGVCKCVCGCCVC